MAPSRYRCARPECTRGPATDGAALHRISPKGEDFVGLCTAHFREAGGKPDEIAVIIEEFNRGPDR